MFALIAALAASFASSVGAAAAAVGAVIGMTAGQVLFQSTLLIGGAALSRRQRRQAENQFNDSLRDRNVTIRSSDEAAVTVYGRMRVGGLFVYGKTHGERGQRLSLVIALAGHECDAIEDIWFDDQSIGALDGSGNVQPGSRYYRGQEVSVTAQVTPTATGTVTFTGGDLTLPASGMTIDSVAYVDVIPSGIFVGDVEQPGTQTSTTLRQGTDWVQIGTTASFTLNAAAVVGKLLVVTLRYGIGAPLVRVKRFLGTTSTANWPTGQRDTDLEGVSGGEWTANHLGLGVTKLHITLEFDPDIFPQGVPTITAIVRGKKLYDPRTGLTAWSRDPVLITRDYLTSPNGFNCSAGEINDTEIGQGATICEQLVPIDGASGTQARFLCDCIISSESTRKDNLETILSSMLGTAFYSAGVWIVRPAAYRAPVMTLDDGDLAPGPINGQSRVPKRELFNGVRGRFRDAASLYTLNSFVPYSSSTYRDEDDGEELWREIDLPSTTDAKMARRIAKLILQRSRQAIRLSATFKLGAYALQPGDTVRLRLKPYGWDLLDAGLGKVFRVTERSFDPIARVVSLVLVEEAEAIYAWDFNEALGDPAPNTALPDPRYVAPPANVVVDYSPTTFRTLSDGTVVPYVRVSFDAPTTAGVTTEIHWKRTSDTEYRRLDLPIGSTYGDIEGVSGGESINLFLRHVSQIGVRSVAYFIGSFLVHPDLPANGAPLGAISANLLTNASFDRGAGGWTAIDFSLPAGSTTLEKRTDGVYAVVGSPSSANIVTVSTATGAQYVGAYAERISVTPGRRYVAYCGVIGWDTPAYVAAQVFGENDVYIAGYDGNVIPAGAWEGALRWNAPDHYHNSSVFFNAPPGARWVRFIVVGGGVWPAMSNPFNARWVSFHKPFFGQVQIGGTELPPWDPGGHNMIDTALLVPGSTSRLYNARVVNVSPVGNAQVARIAFTCPEAGYCTVNAVLTGKFDYSTVFGGTQSHSIGVDVYSGEYPAGPLVVKNLGESYRVIGQASSAGTYRGTGMTQTQFEVVAGEKLTIFLNYIAPGTSSPVCEDGAMQVEYVYR